VNATLSGLTPGSVYHYRLAAANGGGTTNGTDRTFTTLTPPPAVSTGGASNITTSGAQLNGSVNPNGFSTTYHFEYGLAATYGTSTPTAGAGSGTSTVSVNAALSGLTSGSTYHYRLVAASSGGTTNGGDQTLTAGTTVTTTPTVSTGGANNITTTGAQVNGSVNPNGFSTTYHFEYGLAANYGSSTTPGSAGSGTSAVTVTASLSGLSSGSIYHYRLVAANSGGTVNGTDQTLTAGTPPPAVSSGGASSITTTGAQLNGSVNPNGFSTTYHFEYGLTTSYGSSTQSGSAGSGTGAVSVNATLSGLAPGSVYHYRLVAASSGGTANTGDTAFTTMSIVRPGGLPTTHSLEQNYPNPFNPETRIDYELYVAADVSLKVYNALGVEVVTLFSGVQGVGKHSVQWEAKGLVSGVYFCLLKAGGMASSRRMIYVK
jgi:phosphodiesterase/alkaline phosphatase D-like protein